MRRPFLGALAALALGCFSATPPEGRYHCEFELDCLDGFACYEGYCCRKDRLTGLCVDHPCLVNGTDADRDGFPLCADDCNDDDAAIYPGAPELCDGKDNNCDATIDEGATIPRYLDLDGDGHGSSQPSAAVLVCADGPNLSTVADDCDDQDPAVFGGNPEVCDGKDNDCDRQVDEGVTRTWYRDEDADGYGQTSQPLEACEKPLGYAALNGDCQDGSPLIRPGREEVCNGFDDNCDGQTDEGVKQTFFPDADQDGYGDAAGQGLSACTAPPGYAANKADCDDGNPQVHPAVSERCNDLDDDCDGQTDEGVRPTWFRDADGDTWGTAATTVKACAAPTGYVDRPGDCNDAALGVNPAAAETCNGADDDCDGLKDEGLTQSFFRDQDSDGFGTAATVVQACSAPAGHVGNAQDCDDGRNTVWPGAPEACDGLDNDCDGAKDNVALCGPKVDQAEVAGAWGAGVNALPAATATTSGCIAGSAHHQAQAPVADTTQVSEGTASIQAQSSGRDFYLYFPQQRSAGWDLRKQRLHFDAAGDAGSWGPYRQPVVLFCAANGSWARYEPGQNLLGSSFVTVEVTVPGTVTPGGGFSYSAGFAWSWVDWVEVHANPSVNPTAPIHLRVDDFRFLTP